MLRVFSRPRLSPRPRLTSPGMGELLPTATRSETLRGARRLERSPGGGTGTSSLPCEVLGRDCSGSGVVAPNRRSEPRALPMLRPSMSRGLRILLPAPPIDTPLCLRPAGCASSRLPKPTSSSCRDPPAEPCLSGGTSSGRGVSGGEGLGEGFPHVPTGPGEHFREGPGEGLGDTFFTPRAAPRDTLALPPVPSASGSKLWFLKPLKREASDSFR
mmetsp:Transcript_70614/g.206714  ORF Transcript_70614/g.206714 Transcript_70614/m.206714 type:complete len:215 (-) Transcript_70614:254-898(-)